MTADLIRLAAAEWPGLAAFIVEANRHADGGVHCLHAQNGHDVASHATELAGLAPDAAAFWALCDGGRMQAMVGCEFDRSLQRAWVRGPLWVDAGAAEVLLTTVGPALESALPMVRHFDAFPTLASEPLNAWLAAAGYVAQQVHTVLRAPIANRSAAVAANVRRATRPDISTVSALHQTLFPNPYLTESDLIRAVDAADCALFVASGSEGTPSGYLFVQDAPPDNEVYIDYLGVDAEQRGRGLGRALLDAAAHWGAAQGRSALALTVREDRRSALDLYRRSGFLELSSARNWRKTVDAPTR